MTHKQSAYLETSVVSYLAAKLSTNLVVAAHQQLTQEWWDNRRQRYNLFVSDLVTMEAARGDAIIADRRRAILRGIPKLTVTSGAEELAAALTKQGALPEKAAADALHIALAAYHEVDYLVTWNCAHIANAETVPVVRSVCAVHGYTCPQICTPEELMGDSEP